MDYEDVIGVSAPADANRLLKSLNKTAGVASGDEMVIGVRNDAGAIYRRYTTHGLPQFLEAIGVMEEARYEDELENEDEPQDGCDAIFRKRLED